jgi:hypothetical protein
MNNIPHRERQEIANALSRWFQSQRISPRDAVTSMALLIGVITGDMANDEDHLAEGLDILKPKHR